MNTIENKSGVVNRNEGEAQFVGENLAIVGGMEYSTSEYSQLT